MFTGLIEALGTVSALSPTAAGLQVRLRTTLADGLAPGDSLAVNGVCLTATSLGGGEVHADIGPETARVTTLGGLHPEQRVNLERPMRADARFGGHFVQGHVDATGVVEAIRADGDAHWLTIAFDPTSAAYMIPKGSITVDGISLTVADLAADRFDVMIIPFTWTHTNLSAARPGHRVNLEFDMVGKYVARATELALANRLKPTAATD